MEVEAVPHMPKEIATAIVAIMQQFGSLIKTKKNNHGSYKYVPIDVFYERAQALFSEHGLIIIPSEVSTEVIEVQNYKEAFNKPTEVKNSVWVRTTFCFYISHSSGVTWGVVPKNTVMVMASMGSQSSGAALSYSIKNLMRSMFNIATGETEIDDTKPESIPSGMKPIKTEKISDERVEPENVETAQNDETNIARGKLAEVMNSDTPQKIINIREDIKTSLTNEKFRNMVDNAADIRLAIMFMDDADKYPDVEAKLEGCLHLGVKPKLIAEAKKRLEGIFAKP